MGCASSSTAAGAVENKVTTAATRTPRPPTAHSISNNNGTCTGACAAPEAIKNKETDRTTRTPSSSTSTHTTYEAAAFKKNVLTFSSAVSGIVGRLSSNEEDAACEWTIRYSCLSYKGRDPDTDDANSKPNQDAFGVHEDFLKNIKDGANATTTTHSLFFGVYDGHGAFGQECAQFVQQRLPCLIQEQIQQQDTNNHHQQPQSNQQALLHASLHQAHVQCNQELHAMETINDAYSGTTSISLLMDIHRNSTTNRITVCNVGDSRAILGTRSRSRSRTRAVHDFDDDDHDNATTSSSSSSCWQTVSLSIDQTPKRSDEATRCTKAGARILTFGEINKAVENDDNNDDDDNTDDDDDDDEVEDPPRVWAPSGKYPGTAFTRSFGDAVAETLGVYAEPEILTLNISHLEKCCIVLASDGVFDVLSNQQVMDLCFAHYNNNNNENENSNNNDSAATTRACQAVLQASYEEWLRNEECVDDEASASFDDMTIICIFIDHFKEDRNDATSPTPTMIPPAAAADDGQQAQAQQLVSSSHQPKRFRKETGENNEQQAAAQQLVSLSHRQKSAKRFRKKTLHFFEEAEHR